MGPYYEHNQRRYFSALTNIFVKFYRFNVFSHVLTRSILRSTYLKYGRGTALFTQSIFGADVSGDQIIILLLPRPNETLYIRGSSGGCPSALASLQRCKPSCCRQQPHSIVELQE